MAKIKLIGINDDTGQQVVIDPALDVLYLGLNDFAANPYSGGDIDLGTSNDGSFADVDATNAKIDFNVSMPGKYIVRCIFTLDVVGDVGSLLNSQVSFKLTDGTNSSPPILSGGNIPGVLMVANQLSTPFFIAGIFNFTSAGSKTVKLQKKNISSTNINTRKILANSNSYLSFAAVRITD